MFLVAELGFVGTFFGQLLTKPSSPTTSSEGALLYFALTSF